MNSERQPDLELSMLVSAMFDGELTTAEQSRLADLLRDNPDAQDRYLDYCRAHALLRQELGGQGNIAALTGEDTGDSLERVDEEPISRDEAADRRASPDAASFPPPVVPTFPGQALPYAPYGSFTFSYLLAALIIGAGMLIGWAFKVSTHEPIAKTPPPAVEHREQAIACVGRVTGLVDPKWSDAKTATVANASIPEGRRFELASGLMEITYDTGAKVVLEGPCSYTAESRTGGYLGIGRLTAKLEERQKDEDGKKREAPLASKSSTLPAPPAALFVVRTPTASVSDLGTEFGVAVDKSGVTESYVFRGRVSVVALDKNGHPLGAATLLAAKQSARIEKAAGNAAVVRRDKAKVNPASFVRGEQFAARVKQANELSLKPFRNWQAFSERLRKRSDLLLYYDFQRDADIPRDRNGYEVMRNRALTGSKYDGRLVGSIKMGMARGRFPGKDALQFNYPGDGVRLNVPGKFPQLTIVVSAAFAPYKEWAGIFMCDDWGQPGQIHWQRLSAERTKFAFVSANDVENFDSDSPEAAQVGQWHTWAVVVDAPAGKVAAYVDGRLLQRWKTADAPKLLIGSATIGNWKPLADDNSRPLFGAIDEVAVFSSALSDAEIRQLYNESNAAKQQK
jgi:hypothetical protein